MRFVYSDRYYIDIGEHVFSTLKYRMLRERLNFEGIEFIEPEPPDMGDIKLVHTEEYINDLLNLRWTQRTAFSELPLSREIVDGFTLMAGGTILTCGIALEEGKCLHIGGGFHHAFPDHAEGFCYINDIAVGIRKMKREKKVKRVAVIDCDLHQGNGTAKIFQQDRDVFTFSIHQENLYPVKEQSDWDIGLRDFTDDEEYLKNLSYAVPHILDNHKPELCLYVAGADPYEEDRLGSLRLTKDGLRKRDELVIGECRKRGIPIAVVLAGGYASKIEDTVDIHFTTCKVLMEAE